eukprot:TRINITY_DN55368_c0_g1_i1.p1 TRINITY_DN55368_c0_g1~~TRINITY_DN55368_c0_g1_i1.p1  ORF type:complete len:656 (+),score=158.77 TRINITY_DN55368_c0_g1_i1:64-1968(+)
MARRVAAVLFAGAAAPGSAFPQGARSQTPLTTIGIQAHSTDDLREVPQLWQKGVRSFKVDFHWVWRDTSICGSANDGSCFVLTHDNPVAGVQYNTSTDLLHAVAALPNDDGSLRVALCMKPETAPLLLCDGIPRNKDWIAAVDDFYSAVNASATLRAVRWVLDGGIAHPLGCLAQRWRPWGVTYVDGRSPAEALTSNDAARGYDRYAVLNDGDDAKRWAQLATADIHYGKFAAGADPYQLWEPDAQQELRALSGNYLAGGAGTHAPGFDFAINTDPALLRTFLGNHTDQGWSEQVAPAGTTAGLVPLQPSAAGGVRLAVFVAAKGGLSLTVLSAARQYGALAATPLQSFPGGDAVSFAAQNGSHVVSVLSSNCGLASYVVSDSGGAVPVGPVMLLPFGENATCLTHAAAPGGWAAVALRPGCAGVAVLAQGAPWGGAASCVAFGFAVRSAAIVVQGQQALLWVSDGDALHAVQLRPQPGSGAPSAVGSPARIGVGSRPSAAASGGSVVLITDGGFCYDSHSHRTQAKPKLCDLQPAPQASTLTYSHGSFQNWCDALAHGAFQLSPCHGSVRHGTFSQGRNPAVAAYLAGGQPALAVAHDGYDGSGDGGCGEPLQRSGVVLEAFPISGGSGSWGG